MDTGDASGASLRRNDRTSTETDVTRCVADRGVLSVRKTKSRETMS